jgi:hypothetical protein
MEKIKFNIFWQIIFILNGVLCALLFWFLMGLEMPFSVLNLCFIFNTVMFFIFGFTRRINPSLNVKTLSILSLVCWLILFNMIFFPEHRGLPDFGPIVFLTLFVIISSFSFFIEIIMKTVKLIKK